MTTTSNAPTPADRAARLLTEAFAPAHLVIGLLLLIGGASHPSPVRGIAWGALAALLVGALPYTWVLHAVRTERLTSRHIPDKRQRLRPLGIATAAALLAADSLGRIAPGKVADILVLTSNPLDNISNTQTIERVILRGLVYATDSIRASW
jgi:hypothetical protein